MSSVDAISFDSESDARSALASLRSLEKEGQIKFEDTAVVVHGSDGKLEVKNEASSATEGGAVVGAHSLDGRAGATAPLRLVPRRCRGHA